MRFINQSNLVKVAFCLWLTAIAAGSRTLWTHAARFDEAPPAPEVETDAAPAEIQE